jgi:hypothetical protein
VIDEPFRCPSQGIAVRADLNAEAFKPGIARSLEVDERSPEAKDNLTSRDVLGRKETPAKAIGTDNVLVVVQALGHAPRDISVSDRFSPSFIPSGQHIDQFYAHSARWLAELLSRAHFRARGNRVKRQFP